MSQLCNVNSSYGELDFICRIDWTVNCPGDSLKKVFGRLFEGIAVKYSIN